MRNIHKVYHSFCKKFKENGDPQGMYLSKGYSLMIAVQKWAKNYPNDIKIVGIDDSFHAGSDLVLIEHKTNTDYFGITAVVIPQCSGENPIEFFMYPNHQKDLIKALQACKKSC
jgi:hypothetical protein